MSRGEARAVRSKAAPALARLFFLFVWTQNKRLHFAPAAANSGVPASSHPPHLLGQLGACRGSCQHGPAVNLFV
jgi:hypothetical protein